MGHSPFFVFLTTKKACMTGKWVDHEQTQVVTTSWATMALMYAQYPEPEPIERAVKMVMSRQLPVSDSFRFEAGLKLNSFFLCQNDSGRVLGAGSYRRCL